MISRPDVEVLVAGLNVVDVLFRLPDTIYRGQKHETRDLLVQGGAPAGNAACVLASLGWRTGFVGRFGSNSLSQIARAELIRHDVVDEFFISDFEAVPGVSVVEIEPNTGERTVFYNLNGYRRLTRADIPLEAVKRARLVLVDGYETEAALAMLEAAHGTGCRSVIDVEAGEPRALRRLIELCTDAILPLGAAQRLSGEMQAADALKSLSSWTEGQLIATDGVNGSWTLKGGEVIHQPAFKVKVADTTGCGDAYHGAYASALLDGMSLHLRMEFASWVAAQVAMNLGGRSNLPTRDSVRRMDLSPLSAELVKHLQK